ncbi:hypothetical protein IWX46DRAFT_590404 [Phyllosticta citricarpa]|uniref:Secreted protein n=1 Tax=Phyllosticta citricarpa TaxID=55181 RepID=A0ABR1MMA9_9PEZI
MQATRRRHQSAAGTVSRACLVPPCCCCCCCCCCRRAALAACLVDGMGWMVTRQWQCVTDVSCRCRRHAWVSVSQIQARRLGRPARSFGSFGRLGSGPSLPHPDASRCQLAVWRLRRQVNKGGCAACVWTLILICPVDAQSPESDAEQTRPCVQYMQARLALCAGRRGGRRRRCCRPADCAVGMRFAAAVAYLPQRTSVSREFILEGATKSDERRRRRIG